jgi:hypothetical protein
VSQTRTGIQENEVFEAACAGVRAGLLGREAVTDYRTTARRRRHVCRMPMSLNLKKLETFPVATVLDTQHDVDFMVKDSKRFADSGG